MTEQELRQWLKQTLDDGFDRIYPVDNPVLVKKAYQDKNIGQNVNQPSINYYKTSSRFYGHPRNDSFFDVDEDAQVNEITQFVETTFQVLAMAKAVGTNQDASDYLAQAQLILASEESITFLKSKDIGIIRITDEANPFFKDGDDQNLNAPFFTVTLSHQNKVRTIIGSLENVECAFHRI